MENKTIKMLFQVTITWYLLLVTMGLSSSEMSATTQRPNNLFRPFETTSCDERKTAGLICYSCAVVGTCVRINDVWVTIPVAECDNDAGMFCNVREGGCSELAGPCNAIGHQQNFVCSSVGIFPDPYDCQRYHFCQQSGNSLGAINLDCGGSSAYNPTTGQCSLNLNDDVCRFDQFVCDHVGQQAVWPGNDNIFYICKVETVANVTHLYPALYRCAAEEIFNGVYCVPGRDSNISTIIPPTGTPVYDCTAYGLFPFAADCNSYVFCDNDLMPTIYRCPEGTYFENSAQACVRGECLNI